MMEYLMLFWVFFQIGCLGFGGGYAILPLIFQSVQRFGMMGADEFANLAAISQITPGPIAINAATYVGFSTAGLPGAIVATFAFALPSFILVYLAAHFLERFKNSNTIGAIMGGVRPVTVGLIAAAAIFIGAPSLLNGAFDISEIVASGFVYFNLIPILICLCAAILNGKWKVHPILIVLAAGVIGAFLL